jgi:hypothetical protein
MTWTKTGDEFADECWSLSDAAYRLHHEGLTWSNRKSLDGQLAKDDLRRWAKCPEAAAELVDIGWWEDAGQHYQIIHHIGYQPTREEVASRSIANTENARKRWAKQKEAKAAKAALDQSQCEPLSESSSDPLCDSHSDSVCDEDGTGLANASPTKGSVPTQLTIVPSSKEPVVTKSGTSPGAEKPKRASRLPDGWYPPKTVADELHARFPHVDLRTQHELFCNYWQGKGGREATKVDWVKTWRNWIIKAAEQTPTRMANSATPIATSDLRVQQVQALKKTMNGSALNNNRLELET